MTNEHHDPSSYSSASTSASSGHAQPAASGQPSQPSQSGRDYEGFDPELTHDKQEQQQRRLLGLSSVQVGASAMAAVTSALAASVFGVAGTLIGAAVGSIISTIAAAMYAESLRRAGGRLREVQTIAIQKIPLGTEQRPADVPSVQALTQVIPAAADATMVLPADSAAAQALSPAYRTRSGSGSSAGQSSGTDVSDPVPDADSTRLIQVSDLGEAVTAGSAGSGIPDGPGNGGGTATTGGKRRWWRRPVFALPVVAGAGFVLALGVITGVEALTGHPASGGSGTSLSKAFGGSTSNDTPAPTVTTPATTAPSASASPSASPTAATTVAPTTAAPEPTATATAPASSTLAPVAPTTDGSAASTPGA